MSSVYAMRCSSGQQSFPDLQVGLITYGTHVQVHELGFEECAKSYVFRGTKEYTPAQVAQQLGIAGAARGGPPGQPGAGGAAGTAMRLTACRECVPAAQDPPITQPLGSG